MECRKSIGRFSATQSFKFKRVSTKRDLRLYEMLRKLINEYKPDFLGVALDSSGPTFRHESFEAS